MNAAARLLLVDDDELDRLSITRALRGGDTPFEVSQCASAGEALRLAAERDFDAILLDYRLPDQDGIDVLRALRAEKFGGVAVVMLSRHEDEAIAERCLEAGAQDFLLKDEVTRRRLTRAIRQARQRHAMQQALHNSHEQLRLLAECDPLTGLSNRRGFELGLASAIARANRSAGRIGLLLLDLDDFKGVNDTLGHEAGDKLLIEVAQRLRATVRDGDFLCRLGGDEFVVLAMGLEQDDQAVFLADRIIAALREPILIGSSEQVVSASIGIAVLGTCADRADDLLRCADVAMYRAKQDGRNQSQFYSVLLQDAVQRRANIKRDLHNALERGEFEIYYQAQIHASDGTLGGMEALLRWRHPTRGVLPPGEFLSVAEETGMIVDIGNWVLREACSQLRQWQSVHPEKLRNLVLGVNLSAVQLRQILLAGIVESALADNALPATSLELEITENAIIDDHKGATAMLKTLAKMGIGLSLDDFGTGYSSFEHLKLFPISVMKIDRQFVSAIGQSAESDRLLVAIIRFAQALKLKLVAEGIETEMQANFCRENGCDLLQGFYYSSPVPADVFEATFL